MNAVFGSILENLRAINIVTEPTVEVFKGDKTNTSNSLSLAGVPPDISEVEF